MLSLKWFVIRFIFKIFINGLAIFLIAKYLFNLEFTGSWTKLALAGLILGIINWLIK